MAAPNAEKGARYIAQLDTSLCAGAWHDIAEHARKVDKHAPDRPCLTLAARAEAQVAAASHRPTSASSSATSSIHGLGDLVPALEQAIAKEEKHVEDAYAASVCMAEIRWLRGELDEALAALKRSNVAQSGSGHVTALGWQEVCEVKASFLTGAVLEAKKEADEARALYLNIASRAPGSRTPELRRWTERLLARACMFMWRATDLHSITSLSQSLMCFQSWSAFWERAPSSTTSTATHLDIARRDCWKAYYQLVSTTLQRGLLYAPSPRSSSDLLVLPDEGTSHELYRSAKLQQSTALKRIETNYESLLLNETQFPKASQSNTEIEEWVERAVGNWKVICGPQWTDADLGVGGREAVARRLLDILYRASTKTFHSTAILRQLFAVHASLGEFDLAMHAFDSYVEIVSKGKTRAEKTGKHEIGFDSDNIAVQTAVDAVKLLCKYGDWEQAEKANGVVRTLRKWLGQKRPGSAGTVDTANGDGGAPSTEMALQPRTLAAAYRAIGTCRLHWARLTFDNDARERLRAEGIRNLRMAQAQEPRSLETLSALALAYAECQDVSSATQAAKSAIAMPEDDADDEAGDAVDYRHERQLMPLWHLLALCRGAGDDHEQATKMCEAAFGQFGDSTVLFGERGMRTSVDSEQVPRSERGVVDQMDGSEKETLVQIKMSQLCLVELMEGAETAVKHGEELLALYARLFGSPTQPKAVTKPPPTASSTITSRHRGTLRSIAGSIRPRSRSRRVSAEGDQYRPPTAIAEEQPDQPASTDGRPHQADSPIAITVTNEDGFSAEKHHRHLPFKLRHHHDSRSLRSARSNEQLNEKAMPETPDKTDSLGHDVEKADITPDGKPGSASAPSQNHTTDSAVGPGQPLGRIPHNTSADAWPAPAGHQDQPLRQDIRLPAPPPTSEAAPQTHFSKFQERHHKVSLLVDVWLFIAGVYLRADHFDDCAGAVDAAFHLVEQFEEEVASEGSSARRFHERGWGLGKSVDEIWGDVWAAVSTLPSSLSIRTLLKSITERHALRLAQRPLRCPVALRTLPLLLARSRRRHHRAIQPAHGHVRGENAGRGAGAQPARLPVLFVHDRLGLDTRCDCSTGAAYIVIIRRRRG